MTNIFEIITADYLLTTLLVTLVPGTGVVYTLSVGLFSGRACVLAAVTGCTASIVPHLLASVFGLAAILHASATLFHVIKYAGVIFLLYLAWGMWRDRSAILTEATAPETHGLSNGKLRAVAWRGVLINLLNPKLTLFFLAFLPQFVPAGTRDPSFAIFLLAIVFMAMTFGVFSLYGLFAVQVRELVLSSEPAVLWLRRMFAAGFAGFALKLAFTQRGD